jgi:hypothetical protein|tara:strand:- start:567 stop:737 length:171 start_codon:yes stop_codon:yes gene_type:complete
MPLPFFCAICDKPIVPSRHRKHNLIHNRCMDEYLSAFEVTNADEFNESTSTSKNKK